MLNNGKNFILKRKKVTEIKTNICYYLDLPETERKKFYQYKNEKLVLSKKNQSLSNKFERCVIDKTKICKKHCKEFENQNTKNSICRNQCRINKKRQCIQFETQKDFSKTLSIKINRRPWENYQKCRTSKYSCYCNKLVDKEKKTIKINRTGLSDGKSLPYQGRIKVQLENYNKLKPHSFKHFLFDDKELSGQFLKTFQIKYNSTLSLTARNTLTSFTNKYIYYAIDDIICLLSAKRDEQNNLLSILYSSMLSLHNDFSVNFFDIWIDSIYLNEKHKTNRFLMSTSSNRTKVTYTTITLKLHYFTRTPNKKPETIW